MGRNGYGYLQLEIIAHATSQYGLSVAGRLAIMWTRRRLHFGVISLQVRFQLMHSYPIPLSVGRAGGVRGAHQVTRGRHQNRSDLLALDTVRDADAARSILAARAPGRLQAAGAVLTNAQRQRPVGGPRHIRPTDYPSPAGSRSDRLYEQPEYKAAICFE